MQCSDVYSKEAELRFTRISHIRQYVVEIEQPNELYVQRSEIFTKETTCPMG